ncbi:HAD family hydrolase [Ensifer adhaerens]|uniref:HAD-IA family hydrolase n=1 Tax=Ensifer canadensis TaxID=555315 RepID=UPI00148FA7C5|nr:HAD-IA family hydrolase [Ensifer canadensis]NOV20263.1 HAD family hydrolase [Ensifer canadensis]
MRPAALIFDVDGTLAETEELHRRAFNAAFKEAGLNWVWDCSSYGDFLRTTGGKERIAAYANSVGTKAIDISTLHRRKTEIYRAMMASTKLELRPGVKRLIDIAYKQSIRMAIATTTTRSNVDALIAATLGGRVENWFSSVRCGEDVTHKKPHPEVYERVLRDLSIPPDQCWAFEDSRMGLQAALAAGVPTVVTPSLYTQTDDFSGATLILRDLATPYSAVVSRGQAQLAAVPGPLLALL